MERRQAFHQTEIINSAAYAQSSAEGILNRPAAKKAAAQAVQQP